MKGNRNILERRVFDILSSLCTDLYSAGISYCIIGGLGVQLHLAHLYGNKGEFPVNKCVGLEPLLRGTGDLDIIVQSHENPMSTFFNQFALQHPSFKTYNGPNYSTVEGITINYIDSPDRLKGPTGGYQEALDHPQEITVAFGNRRTSFMVQRIEYFIAAKLTGNRVLEKDWWDIEVLLRATHDHNLPLDYGIIRQILETSGKIERGRILDNLQEKVKC